MTARRFVDALNRGAPVAPGVMARKDGSLQGRRDVTGIDTESLGPGALASRLRHLTFALSDRDCRGRVVARP